MPDSVLWATFLKGGIKQEAIHQASFLAASAVLTLSFFFFNFYEMVHTHIIFEVFVLNVNISSLSTLSCLLLPHLLRSNTMRSRASTYLLLPAELFQSRDNVSICLRREAAVYLVAMFQSISRVSIL